MEDKFFGSKYHLDLTVQETYGKGSITRWKPQGDILPNILELNPNNTFGFEVEVEGIEEPVEILGWQYENDGSLRNCGKEYISIPTRGEHVNQLLNNLYEGLPDSADFHTRAGIHIHANCLDMTLLQVQTALIYYYLLEPAFFRIAEPYRKESAFCVPLRDCNNILEYLTFSMGTGTSKYAALNRLPLVGLGTLEFRHLQSTNDMRAIGLFVQMIDSIFTFAKENTHSIEHILLLLNENSIQLVEWVLGNRLKMFVEEGVLHQDDVVSQAEHFLELYAQKSSCHIIADNFDINPNNTPIELLASDYAEEEELDIEEFV